MADEKSPGTTTEIQKAPEPTVALSMDTVAGFEGLQRAARMFASSDMVPKDYKGNIPNCAIALDVAMRMRANPLMVFQNLNIIHGKPGWSSAFLIATANASGRFTPLRFKFSGTPGKDDYGCRCVSKDVRSGEELEGTLITIGDARKNQWFDRAGSKWQTLPEQMLRYRAAAFWVRAYAPELGFGLLTREEWEDELAPLAPPPEPKDVTPVQEQQLPKDVTLPAKAEAVPESAPVSVPMPTGTWTAVAAESKEPEEKGPEKLKAIVERIKKNTQKAPVPAKVNPDPRPQPVLFDPQNDDGDIKA